MAEVHYAVVDDSGRSLASGRRHADGDGRADFAVGHFDGFTTSTLVAGSSFTFIYGAFAAVPLFLLWIYISWTIVLVSAIVIHSLSAYQDDAQARRPMLLKALELLEALWRRQADGGGLRELELLGAPEIAVDAESWQRLRDRFLDKRLIARDEDGRYRLARNLHDIPLWQLQEWIVDEGDLPPPHQERLPAWERRALTLLSERRRDARAQLNTTLAELFSTPPASDRSVAA